MKLFVRVAGVIDRAGMLLTHQAEERGRVYNALPGGHLEAGETSAACLERELMEEFGVEITVGRLLYVAEGMFMGGRKHPKLKHEIVFYYRAALRDPAAEVRSLEAPRIVARWLPLDGLESLFPAWLRPMLPADAASGWTGPTRHIVADERAPAQPALSVSEL
ncbi:MAG TPA: NUDIX domain-containing protein [Herpetosiphonaceae bacterium]|nr:NUDIX domain-containing protein [Herpetosiphonaceae bacterium]